MTGWDLVGTRRGPRLAFSPEAVRIVATESAIPGARVAALAWLVAYDVERAAGAGELEARGLASDAWEQVARGWA